MNINQERIAARTKVNSVCNSILPCEAIMRVIRVDLLTLIIVTICLAFLTGIAVAAPTNVNITNNPSSQNEPMVAIDPLNHNHLVVAYNDNRSSGNYGVSWSWSENGGNSWQYGEKFSFYGYTLSADPSVAFDNAGTVYIVGLAYNPRLSSNSNSLGRDGSVFIASSTDGGHTFNNRHIIVTGSGTATYYDKPWLYINPLNNDIYIAWVKRTNAWSVNGIESSVIEFSRSTNGGLSFSSPIRVSSPGDATGTKRCHGPQITAVSGNHLYVAWHTLEAGDGQAPPTAPWKIWVVESTDGGVNFGTPQLATIAQWGYPFRFISMGSNPATGRIYIAFSDSHVRDPLDYDVYVISAPSVSGPWSTPVRVNDDPADGRSQFYPSLAVAPNGRIDVMWYDKRDDESKLNVYYSYSINGGITWARNSKLTDLTSGFTPVADFAGDYNSLASVNDKSYVVWMDNRNGNQEIYGATMPAPPSTPPSTPPSNPPSFP